MKTWIAALCRFVPAGIVLAVVSGCAGLPQPGTRLDPQRLGNAIVADHVDYVRAAIEARVANVNERIPAPVYMEGTPLITIAARAGAVQVVEYLIRAGADLNARTPAGETALMLAAYFPTDGSDASGRHEKVARSLVEAGATLENEPHHYTPLAYAAYRGHDHMIAYLLKHGARVNPGANPGYSYVNTPLMMAAMQGNVSSALLLLRAGADARVRVVDGHTAAELAAKYQGHGMVSLLKCAESTTSGEVFRRRCENSR
ncbi:MAG: ankyrin repeat domain-containing protein [Burkholderiales bacterium]|nr:ankyrin repeat domain-containing protein [Burkholderiales bacterium]